MKVIGRYEGTLGEIAIWEDEANGCRFYLEGDIPEKRRQIFSGASLAKLAELKDAKAWGRWHKFPKIRRNRGLRDFSRMSCEHRTHTLRGG